MRVAQDEISRSFLEPSAEKLLDDAEASANATSNSNGSVNGSSDSGDAKKNGKKNGKKEGEGGKAPTDAFKSSDQEKDSPTKIEKRPAFQTADIESDR